MVNNRIAAASLIQALYQILDQQGHASAYTVSVINMKLTFSTCFNDRAKVISIDKKSQYKKCIKKVVFGK